MAVARNEAGDVIPRFILCREPEMRKKKGGREVLGDLFGVELLIVGRYERELSFQVCVDIPISSAIISLQPSDGDRTRTIGIMEVIKQSAPSAKEPLAMAFGKPEAIAGEATRETFASAHNPVAAGIHRHVGYEETSGFYGCNHRFIFGTK